MITRFHYPPAHSARAENRWPGQLPDVRKVLPSQPQYGRRSFVQPRAVGAHVPGLSSVQPSPSQVPDSHSLASKHEAPAGFALVDGGGGGVGSVVGGGGATGGGDAGAEHATTRTSNARRNDM